MSNYVLLLPPSEAKIENINKTTTYSEAKRTNSFKEINPARNRLYRHLIEVLSSANLKELANILELKGAQLQKAIRANFTMGRASTLPAVHRYMGIMFKHINYNDMNQKQKDNFNKNTLIIDGMFGIVRPLDLIPDYKLKITSKLAGLNVAKYWAKELAIVLEKELSEKIIIDILPDTHRKVIDFSKGKEHYEIIFAEEVSGKMKNAGHFSKKLKGEFVNFICSKENIEYDDLINWEHSDGFKFSEKYSSKNNIVYLKK